MDTRVTFKLKTNPENMAQVSGTTPSKARRHADLSDLLSGLAFFFSLAVLPWLYFSLVQFQGSVPTRFELWRHVLLIGLAHAFTLVTAARAGGRLDRQIATVASSVLMAHGGVAFVTLASRVYYSNQLMLIAAGVSLGVGFLIVGIRRRVHRDRAAVVGPWHPAIASLKVEYDHVESPGVDLRPYDVVLTTSVEPPEGWTETLSRSMMAGKPFRQLAQYLEDEHGIVSIEHFHPDHLPLGGLTSYRVRKRVFDILITMVSLPVALPTVVLAGLLIRMLMGPKVVFVQKRVGLGGRVFDMYKLRTMQPSASERTEIATQKGDIRVTPLGRCLRRFRIDELPQLWNVLKGDMSLIGPRPEQPALTQRYCEDLPVFAYRSLVRPGITGWAQVRAGYAADLEETRIKLGYDLFYLKNFSFSLDLQILIRTVGALIFGGGVR
ncbi:MAG: sugar transferase [Brevundimonas sp.]|nr:sugar transferase [Brevundimonas sp.]MDZ4060933.1 sugar transferase [Brevundimonas sp.]